MDENSKTRQFTACINLRNNVKKIAIFVDVQNIYYTTKQAYGRSFNYRKLMEVIAKDGMIRYALAYTTYRSDHDGQRKFQDALRHIGFEVKLKPFIQRSDGSAKGDWDVGITIDVLEIAAEVDEIVLLSGDGDFDLLLNKVAAKYNVTTRVYGVPSLTAQSLIEQAQSFVAIDESLLI